MPVFTAGTGYGKAIAAAMGVPYYEYSHQEGHIEAIRFYSSLKHVNPLICFHFSGGTTEALLVDDDKGIFEIVGGSKDIAYGQVLDRVGVSLGLDFPCGEALDQMAMRAIGHRDILTPIKTREGYVNLSGIETQCSKALEQHPQMELSRICLKSCSRSILEMTMQLSYEYELRILLCGRRVLQSIYAQLFG